MLALATVLAVVTAAVAASCGTASASVAPHRHLHHEAHAVPGSVATLAQAPAGLRAAVRKTLGIPAALAGTLAKAKLTASDGAVDDTFGTSVAIAGSTAVVGAPGRNSAAGAAYVFVRSGGIWTQQAELTDPGGHPGDDFGGSVAIAGSTAVVGAVGTNSAAGAAYIFTGSSGTWTQQAELTDPGGTANDDFGNAVAIAGSTAVVGAVYGNSRTGTAYVFTGSSGTWTQQAQLTDPGGTANDDFGASVAIAGSTAVVGAPGSDSDTGAAYVFTGSSGTWTQQGQLTDPGGTANDYFGDAVALSRSTALVGAPGSDSGTGAAYVFAGSTGTWTQQAQLTDPGGTTNDYFGNAVALSRSTALVGAVGTNSGTGAAYAFADSSGTWTQHAKLTASNRTAHNDFGASVAIAGSTAVAGAPLKNSWTGAAYAFPNI